MEDDVRGAGEGRGEFVRELLVHGRPAGLRDGALRPAALVEEPVVVGGGGRRDRHGVPFAGLDGGPAEPARADGGRGRHHLVDRIGADDDREPVRLVAADAEGRRGDVVKARGDRRAFAKAGRGRRLGRDAADGRGGVGDRRQGRPEIVEAVGGEGLSREGLRAHLGEGRARLGPVGAEAAGETEAQPVLAGEHAADRRVALGLVAADPGEDGRRRGGVRHLAGERERAGGGLLAVPGVRDGAGAAVEGEDAGAERRAVAVQQVEPVAVGGGGHGRDVGGIAAREGERLADGGGGRLPERLHVALHEARARQVLGEAAAGGGERRAVDVEDHGLGDGEPVVDADQAGHGRSLQADASRGAS